MKLENKVAIVTGAASGIGLAISEALVTQGARVALCDIDEAALKSAAADLAARGAKVTTHRMDVSVRDDWERLCGDVAQSYGTADILCNNAGISSRRATIGELTPDIWDKLISVNLTGVFNGAHYFLSRMHEEGTPGHIVNTASVCGLFSTPTLGAYTSSKFGVVGLSEVLRSELEGRGIGVSVLCPGFVQTGIASRSTRHGSEADASVDPERKAMIERLSKSMRPRTVAEAVIHAIENNAAYIVTHPEYETVIAARMAGIFDAFSTAPANRTPDDIAALGHSWLEENNQK